MLTVANKSIMLSVVTLNVVAPILVPKIKQLPNKCLHNLSMPCAENT